MAHAVTVHDYPQGASCTCGTTWPAHVSTADVDEHLRAAAADAAHADLMATVRATLDRATR